MIRIGKSLTPNRKTGGVITNPAVKKKKDQLIHFSWLVLLFIIPFLFFSPYLFHSPQPLILPNSTLGTDLTREILPTSVFIQQELIHWRQIPLWRPYILAGAPLAGHPVYPLFYPPYWIIAFLPIPLALNLLVVLHLGWAAAGAFLFLRQINRLSDPAAFAGAMIFGFSPGSSLM